MIQGIDEAAFHGDGHLQAALEATLADMPYHRSLSNKGVKPVVVVTGATQREQGVQVNYEVTTQAQPATAGGTFELPVLSSSGSKARPPSGSLFADDGVDFLATLQAEAIRRGGQRLGRRVSSITRLQAIDVVDDMPVLRTRTRRTRHRIRATNDVPLDGDIAEDAVADIGGVLRFRGMTKNQFVRNNDSQQVLSAALIDLATENGVNVPSWCSAAGRGNNSGGFSVVGIRSQPNGVLKVSFKMTTGGATAGKCRQFIARVHTLFEDGGGAFTARVESHTATMGGPGVDWTQVSVAEGSSLRCTKPRMRSKLRSKAHVDQR